MFDTDADEWEIYRPDGHLLSSTEVDTGPWTTLYFKKKVAFYVHGIGRDDGVFENADSRIEYRTTKDGRKIGSIFLLRPKDNQPIRYAKHLKKDMSVAAFATRIQYAEGTTMEQEAQSPILH